MSGGYWVELQHLKEDYAALLARAEAAEQRVTALEVQLEGKHDDNLRRVELLAAAYKELEAAEKDNKRLREALEHIKGYTRRHTQSPETSPFNHQHTIEKIAAIARTAIGGGE